MVGKKNKKPLEGLRFQEFIHNDKTILGSGFVLHDYPEHLVVQSGPVVYCISKFSDWKLLIAP